MIEVKNLTKKYGSHLAVDHLSFTVEPGQIYGFLGPNGAGKSTTMNIMTGYIGATEGEVIVNGHNISEEPEEAKKCIGYLPEIPPLYPDMLVLEYLRFAAELKKVPSDKREANIRKAMELAGISDMQGRLIKNLSKGYKQRVGLAQAMVSFPEIIILDEPTVGLDPKQIIEMRDVIKGLAKDHTVILSSHILSEISAVCDYILIISHGRLVASDTPENLEKLMVGENSLDFTVRGSREKVESVLMEISDIREVSFPDSEAAGETKVSVKTHGDVDIREELFYALAKAKLPIFRMESIRMSLEDVFLELTKDEMPAGNEGQTEEEADKEPLEQEKAGNEVPDKKEDE